MTLRAPVTASNITEWVRLAANAINSLIARATGADASITALQAADTVQDAAAAALAARVTSLETSAPIPIVTSITLTPSTLPGSPAAGETVYDEADGIVKTWDGSAWNNHY